MQEARTEAAILRSGRIKVPAEGRPLRAAWRTVQHQDPMCGRLLKYIRTGQAPPPKRTGGDNTHLKLIHTMFTKGKARIQDDGLLTVQVEDGYFNNSAVVVPSSLMMGVLQAVHLRLGHPSKSQMTGLVRRYFFCPGWQGMINDLVDSCHRCASLKVLPTVLKADRPSASQKDNAEAVQVLGEGWQAHTPIFSGRWLV